MGQQRRRRLSGLTGPNQRKSAVAATKRVDQPQSSTAARPKPKKIGQATRSATASRQQLRGVKLSVGNANLSALQDSDRGAGSRHGLDDGHDSSFSALTLDNSQRSQHRSDHGRSAADAQRFDGPALAAVRGDGVAQVHRLPVYGESRAEVRVPARGGNCSEPFRRSTSPIMDLGHNHADAAADTAEFQRRPQRIGAPVALEVSLLRSTALAAAEAAAHDGRSGTDENHHASLNVGRDGHRAGEFATREATYDMYSAESDLYGDVPYYQQQEQQQAAARNDRAAALRPIVTEEWTRSMIKPEEEYLLYARRPGAAAAIRNTGYGGVSLASKSSTGASRRGGSKQRQGSNQRGVVSVSSAAAARQIEEDARRLQAAKLVLANRLASESNPRVYRSTGTGVRATSYGSIAATSLGRAPTANRSSQPSQAVSVARTSHGETTRTPPPAEVFPVEEAPVQSQGSADSQQLQQPQQLGGSHNPAAAAAFCRVLSPVPNSTGGYQHPSASVSPPPSQLRGNFHSPSPALSTSRDSAAPLPWGQVYTDSNRVLPNASVMRRRSTPMLFTQPSIAPGLFPKPQVASVRHYASLSAAPTPTSSRTESPPLSHHQQQQQDLRQQTASECEFMLRLRTRMLMQLAEAKHGRRVSTEAYPKHSPQQAAAEHAVVRAPSVAHDSQNPSFLVSSIIANHDLITPKQPDALTPASTATADAQHGRLSMGQRRRPDIVVSVDSLRSLDAVEREALRATSLAVRAAPAAATTAEIRSYSPAPSSSSQPSAPSAEANSFESVQQGRKLAEAVALSTPVGGTLTGVGAVERQDEAMARLLSDPFFPVTSEESFDRLNLYNQEYLSRKKLKDRRQLLNYYAAAASQAPLPPSLLSTPSESDLTNGDEDAYDYGDFRGGTSTRVDVVFDHDHGHGDRQLPHARWQSQPQPQRPRPPPLPSLPSSLHEVRRDLTAEASLCNDGDANSGLGRDINTSVSAARPPGPSCSKRNAGGKAARPIRLRGKGAPRPKKARMTRATATTTPPPPAEDTTKAGAVSTTQPSPPPPPSTSPLSVSAEVESTTDSGAKKSATDSRSDVSRSVLLDAPILPSTPPPRRVSFGGSGENNNNNNNSFGSRSSPGHSPVRAAAAIASSLPLSPLNVSVHQQSFPGAEGVGAPASSFIVNAVMPTAKTGPIVPLRTSNIGYNGGTAAAAGMPVAGGAGFASSSTTAVGSRGSSPASSRANSVGQSPGTPGERRSSGSNSLPRTNGGAGPGPSALPSQTSKRQSTEEDCGAAARLLDAVNNLWEPMAVTPTGSGERHSPANATDDLKEFIVEYRRQLIGGGFLFPACPSSDSEDDKEAAEGGTGEKLKMKSGSRWQGTAAGPFMLALRRAMLMEQDACDASLCVELTADEEQRQKLWKHAITSACLSGTGDRKRGIADGSDEAASGDDNGNNTTEHEEAVDDADAFLASLDDSNSHQRNVQFVLGLFGAFMSSPSAALTPSQRQVCQSRLHRTKPAAGYAALLTKEETTVERAKMSALEMLFAKPPLVSQSLSPA